MAASKKDYEAVAAILKTAQSRTRTHRERTMLVWVARHLAVAYRVGNEQFDTTRFLNAADCRMLPDEP